ncbi:retrotransposon protein, putative, ty1-copia subclass [Tanacetum coccineum]
MQLTLVRLPPCLLVFTRCPDLPVIKGGQLDLSLISQRSNEILENLMLNRHAKGVKSSVCPQAEQASTDYAFEYHACKHEKGSQLASNISENEGLYFTFRAFLAPRDTWPCSKVLTLEEELSSVLSRVAKEEKERNLWSWWCFRASRKLKPGALSLYVGNGQREAVEAIGNFDLSLPSGLCYPEEGIFEMICLLLIAKKILYTLLSTKEQTNLDSALLWHCRLGHISKKRIEKLQHDGLLNSTDLRAFEKCVPCMSGHKHEVFETFKVFQKEVENQLGKTIKSLRSDRGGEYMSQEFLDHLKDHGIIAHRTPPYTPQHNVWGCEALVKRDTLTKPDKLEPRSIKCIFIGYPKETMGYSFYYPPENKVLVARNAEFLENNLIDQEASGSLEDLEIIQEEDTHPSIDTSLNHEEDDLEMDEPQSDIIPIRRSTRTRRPTDRMCLYIDAEEHDYEMWEMQSMKDNEVLDLVELPPNGKTVGSKWLFKKKTDMDGAVHTYKARLVAKGYTQTPGIDYEETFSPVADIRAIRILIAIAAYYDYEIWQMDVKTAFLNGYLNEEVYMEQPEGFVNPKYPNRVCKLKRSIYGLKQASRQWNKRFDDEIKKFGFSQNADEPCVYLKASGSNVTFLILYVDDILIMGNSIPMLQDVKSYLGKCFAMKDLGEAAYILGIKIYRDRSRRLIGLCQSAYIEKILKRFHMENSKRGSIPMQDKLRLSKSQGASTPAELKRMQSVPYASAVGSIMYAVRCTRPDVAFAQNITSRFQQNPGDLHWTTVKNILKYASGMTKDMFILQEVIQN